MSKVINPFSTLIDGRYVSVFMKIGVDNKDIGNVLTISGVEGPRYDGDCWGGCGQIIMHMDDVYLSQVRLVDGWDWDMVNKVLSIWKRWHMNDMRAGCVHQRDRDWGNDKIGEPCPVCGYKYGTAWLYEPLPNHVLQIIETFPTTKKIPAWV